MELSVSLMDDQIDFCVCVCEREREKALTQKEIHTCSSKMLFPIWYKGKPNWMKGGVE